MRSDGLVGSGWHSPLPKTVGRLRWRFFWIASIGTLSAVDVWRNGKRDGSTLSEVTREVCRTSTPFGKATFGFALGHLYCVLWRHIIR